MPPKSPQLALPRICATLVLAALTVPLLASGTSNPWDQTDWHHWTAKDVHQILSNSPWASNCCEDWVGGREPGPQGPGTPAIIVSSQTVREALVRNVQLDKRYGKLDPASRREVDQRAGACLNKKFDKYIVLSSDIPLTLQAGGTPGDKLAVSNMYIATSDGRKITGHLESESVAMVCGAFPQDSGLASLWPLWSFTSSRPLGPGKEVAFPRIVDGKPTVRPEDKTIRIHVDIKSTQGGHPKYPDAVFTIAKLTYQGKPDF
jgi:hypothetical protein